MNLNEAIKVIESECDDPSIGLPDQVFLLLSRLTPIVNVDLLIKDDIGRTLLTWREDIHTGKGWDVPGGIIRLKETASDRIVGVANLELQCQVDIQNPPIAINEGIAKKRLNRSHYISLLYACTIKTKLPEKLKYSGGKPEVGMYSYFDCAPPNLLGVHNIYREYINK